MNEVRVGNDSEHLAFVRDGPDMVVRLRKEGLAASVRVWLDYEGQRDGLAAFFASMAEDWRGWAGAREWSSLQGELDMSATHDGVGSVHLGVAVRHHPGDPTEWSVSSNFLIDAGESMSTLAGDFADWVAR